MAEPDPRPTPTLATVGDNCLDVFLDRDLVAIGGNAVNVAAQSRRAGRDARYFGAVGDDPEGALLLAGLAAAGLDPADVERRAGDTAVTLLRGEGGERRFLLEALGVGERYLPDAERYAAIAACDWVHLGTNPNPDLMRRLAADRVRFSVDLSAAPLTLPLAGVAVAFASAPDAARQPVAGLLAALRAAGARHAVVTGGAAGAWFDDGARVRHVPALAIDVVDTCGAGDSFIAAFVAALQFGADAGAALADATGAAASTCTHLGGFPQTPQPTPPGLAAKHAAAIEAMRLAEQAE
jgi:fructoselysine 6-kinase